MSLFARPAAPGPLTCLLFAVLFALGLPSSSLRAAADTGYDQKISAAQAFASEGSWAKARDTYTAALALAPDSNTRRWCELWVEDAAWHSEKPAARQSLWKWFKEHSAALDVMLKPYTKDLPHDDLWMAILQSEIDLQGTRNEDTTWSARLEIADYLASQAPSPQAARRYLEFLRIQPALHDSKFRPDISQRWLEHLTHAAALSSAKDDRGWFALLYAQLASQVKLLGLEEHKLLWQQAAEAGRDSEWARQIRAAELIARVSRGRERNAPPLTATDVSSLLKEIDSVSADLATLSGNKASTQIKDSLAGLRRWWTGPILQFYTPKSVQSGEAIHVSYGCVGYEQLTIELYHHSLESWCTRAKDFTASISPAPGSSPDEVDKELLKDV